MTARPSRTVIQKHAVTIRDVATEAGVSAATVSRVLNGSDSRYPVNAATRERVLDAIKRLDYRPNNLARELLTRRTGVIGLLVPDIGNPYYPGLLRDVEDVAAAAGYKIVVCSTDRDPRKAREYLDALLLKRVDGIIVAGGGAEVDIEPELFARYDTEVVLIGKHRLPFPAVQINNVQAGRVATSHLLSLGHRAVAYIGGTVDSSTSHDRRLGWLKAHEAMGLTADPDLVRHGTFDETSGYECAKELLQTRRPSAIFAANDRIAFGAMAAASDLGLRVPHDLAVVGHDDVPMASFVRPALTTMAVASSNLGARAMSLLLDLLQDRPAQTRVRPSARLVVRDSCGAALSRTTLSVQSRRAGGGG